VAQVAIRPPDLAAPGVRGRLRRWHRFPPVLLVLACLTAALMAVPVAAVAIQAVSVGVSEALNVLQRPLLPTLLVHTIQLTVLVGVGCAVVGVGCAWAVERTDLPGRKVFRLLLVLPLAVPEFVAGFGWLSIFPAVQGLKGATLVSVFTLYPWVYLPVAASLRNTDPASDDVARTLGVGPVSRFFRVTLPSIRFALLGGVLIVSLYLLAEYGAFAILRCQTFATEIFTEYSLRFNGQTASLFSLILCLLGVGLLLGEYRLRGRARRVRSGAGGRAAPLVRLGKGAPVALLAIGLVILLGLGVPLGSIVYWIVRNPATTLPSASVLSATLQTLWLAGIAAVVTTVLALPVALLTVRHPGRLSDLVERSSYLVRALPGIAIGLTFVTVAVQHFPAIYQSVLLLEAAYVVLSFPLALVAVRAALTRVPAILENTARTLGSAPRSVLWRVTLPLIAPGLGAAAALVWLAATTELTATLLLRPTGMQTLATRFWAYSSGLAYGAAAPYAAVMLATSALPTLLLVRMGVFQQKRA
jgi:iron(III) transport system permease protein